MQKERPLSPHLQVYNMLQITSLLSVMHRGSGIFLSLGSPVLIYWLVSLAAGPEAYQTAVDCFSSIIGRVFLFAWTFALFYHLCNGIRHLFWDIGKGFELPNLRKSGIAVVFSALVLTLGTSYFAYASYFCSGGAA